MVVSFVSSCEVAQYQSDSKCGGEAGTDNNAAGYSSKLLRIDFTGCFRWLSGYSDARV